MAASGEALVLISVWFFFKKVGASTSSYVAMVNSDLLTQELSSEQPPSGEGIEEPIG